MANTHDPFTIQITETVRLKIDLGAETTIAAQRDQEKIAVEIKSFITDSEISEFHTALGQYLNYVQALEEEEPDRALHLAVPLETYSRIKWLVNAIQWRSPPTPLEKGGATTSLFMIHLGLLYNDFFQIPFVKTALRRHAINLIIYDPIQEEINQWKSYSNTDK